MTGLTVMGFGGTWKSLRLFTRKVCDHGKQGLTGHPSRNLGDSSTDSIVDCEAHKGASEGTTVGGSLQASWPAVK